MPLFEVILNVCSMYEHFQKHQGDQDNNNRIGPNEITPNLIRSDQKY